jgi:hypothetical protein
VVRTYQYELAAAHLLLKLWGRQGSLVDVKMVMAFSSVISPKRNGVLRFIEKPRNCLYDWYIITYDYAQHKYYSDTLLCKLVQVKISGLSRN